MADAPGTTNDPSHPERSETLYGYLYEVFLLYYKKNFTPFAIMLCGNMPQNVFTAKSMLVVFAKLTKHEKVCPPRVETKLSLLISWLFVRPR